MASDESLNLCDMLRDTSVTSAYRNEACVMLVERLGVCGKSRYRSQLCISPVRQQRHSLE